MADETWPSRSGPLKIIPTGDVAAAIEWVPFARRKMAELVQLGDYRRRVWRPADGIFILGETLGGMPRVFIEVEIRALMLDYDINELFTLRGAYHPSKPFHTLYTQQFSYGAGWTYNPGIHSYALLAGGLVFQLPRNTTYSDVYVVRSDAIHPTPAYVTTVLNITKSPRRVWYVNPEVWGLSDLYSFSRYNLKGELLSTASLPDPYPSMTSDTIEVMSLGDDRLMLRRLYPRPPPALTPMGAHMYSSDGGISWSLVDTPDVFNGISASLSDGTSVVVLYLDGSASLVSSTSLDGGVTWGPPALVVTDTPSFAITVRGIVRGKNNSAYALVRLYNTLLPAYFIIRFMDGVWTRLPDIPDVVFELDPVTPGGSDDTDVVGFPVVFGASDDPTKTTLGLPIWKNAELAVAMYVSTDGGETWVREANILANRDYTAIDPADNYRFINNSTVLLRDQPLFIGNVRSPIKPVANNPYRSNNLNASAI